MKQQIREGIATTLAQRRLHSNEQVLQRTERAAQASAWQGCSAASALRAVLALTFPGRKHLRSDSSVSALCMVINTALKSWVSGCKIPLFSKASFYHHFTAL